ncbi:hypothetical protein T01_5065 [Trichinella spiralis]|uniref:Uncharacterized protein n=1 Tax=Trichinella spiralis TaxID=6334 RepID=A0A0V1BJW7_TRISP|nr:hypothetical protein T01_5065 [Trichinella spiralis]
MILREKFWVAESWDVRWSFGYQRSEFQFAQQSDFSEYSRPTIHIIDVPHRHSLHHSETMDCCQKIHTDEGLAVTLPLSILASGFRITAASSVRRKSSPRLSHRAKLRANTNALNYRLTTL